MALSINFEFALKCTWQQKFLLAILNLGMISSVSVKKFFNSVKSFHFYGGLKLAFNVAVARSLGLAQFLTSRKAVGI
jgi:hypothetical protein